MKKLLLFLSLLLLVSNFAVTAEEEKKEEKPKFPGKIGLEFKQRVDYQSTDHESVGTSIPEGDALYTRTELKGKVKFPFAFYSLTPWIKDRFETRLNFRDDLTDAADTVVFRGRNRLYLGVNNDFSIENVMDIGVNAELRFQTDLKGGKVSNPLEIRFSPILTLGGEYKFGLSWGIEQFFEFYFDPTKDPADVYALFFKKFGLEGTYSIGFEFFHFFAPKGIKGSFGVSEALLVNVNSPLLDARTFDLQSETFVGFDFSFYGIAPSLGLYILIPEEEVFPVLNDNSRAHLGVQGGIALTKSFFTIAVDYKGCVNVQTPGSRWLNNVESYVKFKL